MDVQRKVKNKVSAAFGRKPTSENGFSNASAQEKGASCPSINSCFLLGRKNNARSAGIFKHGLKEVQIPSLQPTSNAAKRHFKKNTFSSLSFENVLNKDQSLDRPGDSAATSNYRGKMATLCRLLITSIRLSSAGGIITSVAAVILLIYMDFIM